MYIKQDNTRNSWLKVEHIQIEVMLGRINKAGIKWLRWFNGEDVNTNVLLCLT